MVACEQALLFGRVKRAARERAFVVLSRASHACTFHDMPQFQMEILLAGYKNANYPRSIRPLFDRPVVARLPLYLLFYFLQGISKIYATRKEMM